MKILREHISPFNHLSEPNTKMRNAILTTFFNLTWIEVIMFNKHKVMNSYQITSS